MSSKKHFSHERAARYQNDNSSALDVRVFYQFDYRRDHFLRDESKKKFYDCTNSSVKRREEFYGKSE